MECKDKIARETDKNRRRNRRRGEEGERSRRAREEEGNRRIGRVNEE